MSVTLPVGVFVLLAGLIFILLPIPGVLDFIGDVIKRPIRPLKRSAIIAFASFGSILILMGIYLFVREINSVSPDPNETSTPEPTISADPLPTDTLTPLETPALTLIPTHTPIPTSTSLVASNCFPQNLWTPYEQDSLVSKSQGCWNLTAWGFTPTENGMLIDLPYPSSDGQFHGIYTPISNKAEIKFKIQVDTFKIPEERTGNIGIGIINLEPIGPGSSRMIYYHYFPNRSKFYLPMQVGFDGNYEYAILPTLTIAKAQLVVMKVEGSSLIMTFDGKATREIYIPFDKRAFWISYSIPPDSQLHASITDLEIINQ